MDPRLNIVFSRRSIRVYTGEPVGEADIRSLLEAGMAAPSASNRKPWHFIAATDREVLRALADGHPYGKMLANAAVGIAVCGDPAISDWWVLDCAAATENILIAVAGLGLGGVWLGCYGRPERERAVRDVLGIPKTCKVIEVMTLGYPADKLRPKSRKPVGEIVCYDRFQ